ncbi:MAG: hypothetical protein ACK5AN_19515 [Planctomyces sp.]
MQSLRESRDLLMCLGRPVALRTTVTTANVTGRGLESLSANRRYCSHYYAPSFRGFETQSEYVGA